MFPLSGPRVRLTLEDGDTGSVSLTGGGRCGIFHLARDDRTLMIECLSIDEEARGYGLGSEAAHLLRDAALATGWSRLRAWAPADRGLAVYFWSRMGLRPLFGEHPGGGIWFERVLG